MKIYLADTLQRFHWGYHKKFLVKHNLESFFAVKNNNNDWSIIKKEINLKWKQK